MCGKWLPGFLVFVQLLWMGPSWAADDWVWGVPKETDEILANPGMGWETFHGTAKQDKNLPSWIGENGPQSSAPGRIPAWCWSSCSV